MIKTSLSGAAFHLHYVVNKILPELLTKLQFKSIVQVLKVKLSAYGKYRKTLFASARQGNVG